MESKEITRVEALQAVEAARTMLPIYRESAAKGDLTAGYLCSLSNDLRTIFEGLKEGRDYLINQGEEAAQALQAWQQAREHAQALHTELSQRGAVDDGSHRAAPALKLCRQTAQAIAHLCRDALDYNKAGAPSINDNTPKPDKVWTPRAKAYFKRAMQAGHIEQDGERLHWNGSNVSLHYFLRKVYKPRGNGKVPYKDLKQLFGVDAAKSYVDPDGRQPWMKEIDKLFVG